MCNTPEIIKREIAARSAAGLAITFHYPKNWNGEDLAARDVRAFAKDCPQLDKWTASAKARGLPFTIGAAKNSR